MKAKGVDEFSDRLDKIFEMGDPTKAMIIDAYNKCASDEECKCINNNDIYMTTNILCKQCNKEVKTIRIRT